MIKKTLPFLGLLFVLSCKTQSNVTDDGILNSNNIKDIENFLKKAHEDDPRRALLKSKIIALKNAAWTSGAKNAKPMKARAIITEIPGKTTKGKGSNYNEEEFKKLLKNSPADHQKKTVKLLNTLFNEDISSNEVILMIQNNSDCNMILRIEGANFYNLAVPRKGENSIVIKKGNYNLSSSICDVKYNSKKEISKSLLVTLSNPH